MEKGGILLFEYMKIRWFLLSGFIFSCLLFIGLFFLFDTTILNDEVMLDLMISYTILGVFPMMWFYWQLDKQNQRFEDIIYFRGVSNYLSDVVFITLTLIFFSIGAFWFLGYVLSYPLPQYVEWLLAAEDIMPEQPFFFVLMAIYISFIGPIAEELIFRGLLLKRLGQKFNILFSIIVTNLLFGILHMDILGAFIFGFIASLLYLHSGNLLVPILVHILNNLSVTILMIINPPMPEFLSYETIAQLREQVIPNVMILVITAPILFVYIRKYSSVLSQKKEGPET